MKTSNTKWYAVAAICFILAMLAVTARAQAAGPATNVLTLVWTPATPDGTPFYYEIQQSLLNTNAWATLVSNIPSNQVSYTFVADRDKKFFRIRSVNSTNSTWVSDFSNVASTVWPPAGGNLGIRLGP